MNWRNVSSGVATIFIVLLSVYFGAAAAAPVPSSIGPALTVYQLGPLGSIVASTTNAFEAGQEIWIGIPTNSLPPYTLTIANLSGFSIYTQQNSTAIPSGLIPLGMAPRVFPAGQSYTVSLLYMVPYTPGLSAPQTAATSFALVKAFGGLSLKNYSFQNSVIQTHLVLQDSSNNPLTHVRLGLFLIQGNSSLQITTETTDMLGRSNFTIGESLTAGNYQFQVRVLDTQAVFAAPILLPAIVINLIPTSLTALNATSGRPQATLVRLDNNAPIPGRLVVLEQQLADGNWFIVSTFYTDVNGVASFRTPTPLGTWHVVFKGDALYGSCASDRPSNSTSVLATSLGTQIVTQFSTFSGNAFSNGHITVRIAPSGSTIYDPSGVNLLGRLSWEIQSTDAVGQWHSLTWDGPFSYGMDDPLGLHRVTLGGTAGSGQVMVSMSFVAKLRDALFTPLRMPVDLEALRGSFSYRLVLHVDGVSASFFQLEHRTGDKRTLVQGPFEAGAQSILFPRGENSMVALAGDGRTILFGLNWNDELEHYQGTNLSSGSSGASISVQLGDVTLSQGQHWITPDCPCQDGGGGTTGSLSTTTTLYLPSSPYSTFNTVLAARVKDQNGNAVTGSGIVWFYRDGTQLGFAALNSTGFASFVWNPQVTGSHSLNATFVPVCCYTASSAAQTLTVNPTPTTIEMLKPQQIGFSWDIKSNVVIPVVTLTLAASGNGSPANIYMPPYSGTSTVPPVIPGYGWAGLNYSSSVTLTLNGTSPTTLTMNWTRNFYMPSCLSTPCSASTAPAIGHLNFAASLSPPSNLYSSSTTTLNLPYQLVVGTQSTSSNRLSQDFTPPSHLYVNVTADYPFLTVKMQNLPIALASYTYSLYHSLGGPASSSFTSPYTYYGVPATANYAYVCTDPSCRTPASGVSIAMLNSNGHICGSVTTDNFGLANIWLGYTGSCASPLPTAGIYTLGTNLTLSTFYQVETGPTSLYTNFQGYAYSAYAPLQTGQYIMPAMSASASCAFTIINPNQTYPIVQCAGYYPPEIFLNVEKHPLQAQGSFTPGTMTILDKVNATIQLTDLANNKAVTSASFNYAIAQTNPGSATISSGVLTTNGTGVATLNIGKLAYGNYSLSIIKSTTPSLNALSTSFSLTIYKAIPTLITYGPPTLDGSSSAFCGNLTFNSPCSTTLSTAWPNDIIIVIVFNTLGGCNNFSVSDSGGLTWIFRRFVSGRGTADAIEEFYAKSNGVLSSDTINETILGCYAGYNGLQVFGIAGANFGNPFDPNSSLPAYNSDTLTGQSSTPTVSLATSDPDDMVFATVQHGTAAVPTVSPGYTWIGQTGDTGTEYGYVGGPHPTFSLGFSYSTSSYYEIIADAVQGRSGWVQGAIASQPYVFTTSLANNATQSMISVAGLTENVYVNGALLGAYTTSSVGSVSFSWTPAAAGQYNITIVFPGQSYYTRSSSTSMVSVARRPVVLAVANSPQVPNVNDRVTWNVIARDLINNSTIGSLSISQNVGGTLANITQTDQTGTAVFIHTFSTQGSYTVSFVSAQNSIYSSATFTGSIAVFMPTSLVIQGQTTITVGQQNSFTATLKDNSGNVLAGKIVQIGINGASYQNLTTNSLGQAQFNWRPSKTGAYTITTNFSPSTSDFGYKPSSGSLSGNVTPQSITNSQTTASGTQTVNYLTAQGSTQSSVPPPSISFSWPDPFTIAVSIQYNGKTAQASSHLSNSFPWVCSWWGCLPYWLVSIDASVSGVFSLDLNGPGLGIATGASLSIFSAPPTDEEAFDNGATVSGAIALGALAALLSSDMASVATVFLGLPIAMGAGAVAYMNSASSYRSFLLGLMLPPLLGFPCIYKACGELPDTPMFFLLAAAYIWVRWEFTMFKVLWTEGGFVGALAFGIAIVCIGLLVTVL